MELMECTGLGVEVLLCGQGGGPASVSRLAGRVYCAHIVRK